MLDMSDLPKSWLRALALIDRASNEVVQGRYGLTGTPMAHQHGPALLP